MTLFLSWLSLVALIVTGWAAYRPGVTGVLGRVVLLLAAAAATAAVVWGVDVWERIEGRSTPAGLIVPMIVFALGAFALGLWALTVHAWRRARRIRAGQAVAPVPARASTGAMLLSLTIVTATVGWYTLGDYRDRPPHSAPIAAVAFAGEALWSMDAMGTLKQWLPRDPRRGDLPGRPESAYDLIATWRLPDASVAEELHVVPGGVVLRAGARLVAYELGDDGVARIAATLDGAVDADATPDAVVVLDRRGLARIARIGSLLRLDWTEALEGRGLVADDGTRAPARRVAVAPNGRIALADDAGRVWVRRWFEHTVNDAAMPSPSWEHVATLAGPAVALTWTADGAWLVADPAQGPGLVWRVTASGALATGVEAAAGHLASPAPPATASMATETHAVEGAWLLDCVPAASSCTWRNVADGSGAAGFSGFVREIGALAVRPGGVVVGDADDLYAIELPVGRNSGRYVRIRDVRF